LKQQLDQTTHGEKISTSIIVISIYQYITYNIRIANTKFESKYNIMDTNPVSKECKVDLISS